MSVYTAGEWVACTAANGSAVTVRSSKNSAKIATMQSDHPDTKGRKMANARLIAAAPEMLALLKRVERDIDMGVSSDPLSAIRAAIAKAEGRA